jgi:hypothetical protein
MYGTAVQTPPLSALGLNSRQFMLLMGILQTVGAVTLVTNNFISGSIGMILVALVEYTLVYNANLGTLPPNPVCSSYEPMCLTHHLLHAAMFFASYIVAISDVGLGGAFTRATTSLYAIKDELMRAGEQVKDVAMDVAGTVQQKTAATLGPIKDKVQDVAARATEGVTDTAKSMAQQAGINTSSWGQSGVESRGWGDRNIESRAYGDRPIESSAYGDRSSGMELRDRTGGIESRDRTSGIETRGWAGETEDQRRARLGERREWGGESEEQRRERLGDKYRTDDITNERLMAEQTR